MLMGHYDAFYNDNIIPEEYDYIAYDYKSSIVDFNQSPGSGQMFHDNLISFASSKNITPDGVGMNITQEKNLTIEYLKSQNIEFNYKYIEGNWVDITTNAAANHIKEAINNNNPVFLGAAGHATVAYAYDSKYVYVHSGWGNIRRTPWSTVTTDFWNFSGGPHTIEINSINSEHYHSDNYFSRKIDKYLCGCGMVYNHKTISPMDYGFDEQYFFYEKVKNVTIDDLVFKTKRLRCGYIEEEVINLAPRRKGAGLAYLQFNFDNYIRKVSVELSMWSAFEYMYSYDSSILLEYLDPDTGIWTTYFDLLNDISLSKDRSKQDNFIINFPNRTKIFRFYSTSSALGDRNKGRLSIGVMCVEYA